MDLPGSATDLVDHVRGCTSASWIRNRRRGGHMEVAVSGGPGGVCWRCSLVPYPAKFRGDTHLIYPTPGFLELPWSGFTFENFASYFGVSGAGHFGAAG